MKIFIVAGDQSGDNYGAKLMQEVHKINPEIEFLGIGGRNMFASGLKSIAKLEDISVIGFIEVAKKYFFFKDLLKQCQRVIVEEEVNLFLPIDYPGFNLRLSDFCKKNKVPVLYFIAPQLWAWGANRVQKLKSAVNKLIVILPFEKAYFQKSGIDTEFFGHPLLDSEILTKEFIPILDRNKIITIMPGSRKQEVKRHLPLLCELVKLLSYKYPDYEFNITKSNLVDSVDFDELLKISNKVKLVQFEYEQLRQSRFAFIKTGTSNIEAALCGLPFAMYYKTSNVSYYISKWLINLPYISLINIILNKKVVEEFIQTEANVQNLANEVEKHINHVEKSVEMIAEFDILREQLGKNGATSKLAQYVVNYLSSSK